MCRRTKVIHWEILRHQGVDFAYIKASEGGDFRDKKFTANWDAAAHAGIRRGAYHFFTLCRLGAEKRLTFSEPCLATALP
jgi:lysozyme